MNIGNFETNMGIPISEFLFCIIFAALYSLILRFIYNFINHESNEIFDFSRSFVLVTISTFFVVFIVKSSLTLSLGLVGALSIVRFRTPIKDPLELAILFACIGVGIGLAVQAYIIVFIFYFTVIVFLVVSNILNNNFNFLNYTKSNKILEIESKNDFDHSEIVDFFKKNKITMKLIATNTASDNKNSLFLIYLNKNNQEKILEYLGYLSSTYAQVKISFREN